MVEARRAGWTQITHKGVTKNASEWARELGLSRSAFMRRIELWGVDEAITRPRGKSGPKKAKSEREEEEKARG